MSESEFKSNELKLSEVYPIVYWFWLNSWLLDLGTLNSKKKNQINGLSPPMQVKKEIHELFENEHILR